MSLLLFGRRWKFDIEPFQKLFYPVLLHSAFLERDMATII
jgi:hypothetical protein